MPLKGYLEGTFLMPQISITQTEFAYMSKQGIELDLMLNFR